MSVLVDNAITFFDFMIERHCLYERRQAGLPQEEWTDDLTLKTRKFTNIFRWLDPGSQFVITDLLPDVDEADALFRCALYRFTNWPDTWIWLREQLGHYPVWSDLPILLDAMRERRALGHKMFSGAYMILPQPGKTGDKLEHVLQVVDRIMDDWGTFDQHDTQEGRHANLTSHYGVGNFLGLQILTDYMYRFGNSTTEDEFVVPGPGSNRGTAWLAPNHTPISVIRWAHRSLQKMPDCPKLGGRQPSVMDLQNCFCEISKYIKGPRKNIYKPAHPGPLPDPTIPTAYRR